MTAIVDHGFQLKDPMQLEDDKIIFEFERAWIEEDEREAREGATSEGNFKIK